MCSSAYFYCIPRGSCGLPDTWTGGCSDNNVTSCQITCTHGGGQTGWKVNKCGTGYTYNAAYSTPAGTFKPTGRFLGNGAGQGTYNVNGTSVYGNNGNNLGIFDTVDAAIQSYPSMLTGSYSIVAAPNPTYPKFTRYTGTLKDGPFKNSFVYINTENSCPVGSLTANFWDCLYPASPACILSNASLVKEPPNKVCTQYLSNGIYLNNPKDPDCTASCTGSESPAKAKGDPENCAGS